MVWTPFTRLQYDRSNQRYTSDLKDAEFALIKDLFPPPKTRGRKRSTCLRAVMNGIFYVLQNGCSWANLPKDFPPTSTVFWYFRRFSQDGTLPAYTLHFMNDAVIWREKSRSQPLPLSTASRLNTALRRAIAGVMMQERRSMGANATL